MQKDRQSRRLRDDYVYERLGQEQSNLQTSKPSQGKWTIIWRLINLVMVVFFLLAAYVQINDPDPYIWIPVYCVPAALSTVIVFRPEFVNNPVWRITCVVHMALCVAGTIYLLVIVLELLSKTVANPLVYEEGRELSGLVIIIIWLGVCRFTSCGSSSKPGTGNALLLMTGVLALVPLAVWGLCFIPGVGTKLGHCHEMFPGVLGGAWTKS